MGTRLKVATVAAGDSAPLRGVLRQAQDERSRPDAARLTQQRVGTTFAALRDELGAQSGWWPQSDGPIEVCAGAILVQHTSWRSAALAIEALRSATALSWQAWLAMPEETLGLLVRPAGTYRAKVATLRALAQTIAECGSLDELFTADTDGVRARLLRVRGIGDETADAIALYAARKATFPIDAYARRLFERAGAPLPPRIGEARALVVEAAERDVERLREWHALAVEQGRASRAYALTRGENGAGR